MGLYGLMLTVSIGRRDVTSEQQPQGGIIGVYVSIYTKSYIYIFSITGSF